MNNSNITVTIGSTPKTFRFRSETKDGADVYFDATPGIAYQNATKVIVRMAAPEGDRGRFTHHGEARIPFARLSPAGVASTEVANVTITVRTSTALSDEELVAVGYTLKALAGDDLLARAVRDRSTPGWPALPAGT